MTVSDLRVLVDNLDEYIQVPGGIERLRKTILHLDRWGMISDTAGGAAIALNILLVPSGKADTDSGATRLCASSGGGVTLVRAGGACP